MSFAGKVVLVTGATKGIGRLVALSLARGGANIVFSYDSDVRAADEVHNEIGWRRALSVRADTSKVADIKNLVNRAIVKFGKIDILLPFNGMLAFGRLESTSEESFDRIFAQNVKGPFFLCQQSMTYMPPGSHIVFLSTNIDRPREMEAHLPYLGTKGAMDQMISLMSKQLKRKEINVQCATPSKILEWVTSARRKSIASIEDEWFQESI